MFVASAAQVDLPPVETLDPFVRSALAAVLAALVVLLVGRLFVTPAVVRVVRSRNRDNPTIQEATSLYLRVVVLTVAVVAAVVTAGYGDVLTDSALVVAAATLAIGVAGQDVIGNLVSGVFLVADSNFNVDDYIAWNDREGTVEAIGFRTTRVRTIDHREVTVPNTELAANAVVRPFARSRVRKTVRLPFDYGADVPAVRAALVPVVEGTEGVREEPDPTVSIAEFGEAAVWLRVDYWVANPMETDVAAVETTVTDEVKRVCDDEGFPLSPPTYGHLSGDVTFADSG
ncbi:mechanosensitive ion channel family protein [Halogeometricum limi]|uniref:Mechanosensitive ion channel n=1 Tax=Halogeometricum limi TaxID=555875 RepID=A0A1I6FXW1_9EURY|nr:mechanosensitive ion channel domain-containing protein [Halogeometricum limi]SFR34773.1 Mechanosensitive ion channel [Halogeometricum limi]